MIPEVFQELKKEEQFSEVRSLTMWNIFNRKFKEWKKKERKRNLNEEVGGDLTFK